MYGSELYAYDTSNASCWLVADISPGTSSTIFGTYLKPILVGDTIYFDALPSMTGVGRELWAHNSSNGSTWQATVLSSAGGGSNPGEYMTVLVGDTLYFDADDGVNGRELWAHDTSNHSAWLVADLETGGNGHSNPGYYMANVVGDTIYFDALQGLTGNELWAQCR